MASVKKILEKHQAAKKTIVVEAQQPLEQTQAVQHIQPVLPRQPQFVQSAPSPALTQQKELEPQAIEDYELASTHNPYTFETTSKYFPGSAEVMELCKFPLGFFMSPYPDAGAVQAELQADKVPRCNNCRSYLNLYCKVAADGNSYACSICTHRNHLTPDARARMEGPEGTSASYTVYPPESQFPEPPCVNCFVFMLDVSNSAFASQMLFYAVSAIKEVLADQKFDDYYILLYTYDEALHWYDLEGAEPTRTVIDRNIGETGQAKNTPYLSSVRTQLYDVLDSLEELAKFNPTSRSNFFGSFATLFEATRLYNPKVFITQANELFIAEEFALQKPVAVDPNAPKKSVFQTTNKQFFNQYVGRMLECNISMAFFTFSKNHKNLRVMSDLAKLTNSQLQLYLKDSKEDLMKFYYDFYSLLGAPYLGEFKMELNLTPGWTTQGVYGNMYRTKQNNSSCRLGHLDDKKRFACNLAMMTNYVILPRLCVQMVCTYSQQRVRKTTISTLLIPLTNSAYHIYQSANYSVCSGLLYRMYLSNLRMENSLTIRSKMIKAVSILHIALKGLRKGVQNFSSEQVMFFQGALSFLKNQHCHPENFLNTLVMDKLVCQRTLLQCTGSEELVTFFTPYLFRLSEMPADCCVPGDNGISYPENCQLSFQSISNGIFLMDCSTHIYLFIARNYNPLELQELFGIDKYSKETALAEDMLSSRSTVLAQKVLTLLGAIRQRKYFQYAPLYIVKCGQGSSDQLLFYLNFTNEKYEQFRNLSMSFKQFMGMLDTQVGY